MEKTGNIDNSGNTDNPGNIEIVSSTLASTWPGRSEGFHSTPLVLGN